VNSHTASVGTDIKAGYDQNLDAGTANDQTFAVHAMQTGQLVNPPHSNSASVAGGTITFTPGSNLQPGDLVLVTATTAIENTSSEASNKHVWQFRTGVTSGTGGFTDSSQDLGDHSSYAVAIGDLDGDGNLDAFVANIVQGNRVWINDGSDNYTDSGQSLGDHDSRGMALGDLDGDGDLDALVLNNGQGNRVWINDGSGNFTDGGQILGNHDSSGVALGDLDDDGDLDAFVVNGVAHGNRAWLNCNPPQISGVLVAATAWNPAFLDQLEPVGAGGTRGYAIPVGSGAQLDTISWVNVDKLIIRFNKQVAIDQNDLVLSGVLGPDGIEDANDDYSFIGFTTQTGPTGEFQAVWTISAPLRIDKLLIKLDGITGAAMTDLAGNKLDGEWVDSTSTFPSGDGTSGGNFDFEFRSLPGDVNNSDTVDKSQAGATTISFPGFGTYSIVNDVNGDGFVVSNDVLFTRARNGDTLPASAPSGPGIVLPPTASGGGTSSTTAPPQTSQPPPSSTDTTEAPVETETPPVPPVTEGKKAKEQRPVTETPQERVIDVLATIEPLRERNGRIGRLRDLRSGRMYGHNVHADLRILRHRSARLNPIEQVATARRTPRVDITVSESRLIEPNSRSIFKIRNVARNVAQFLQRMRSVQ